MIETPLWSIVNSGTWRSVMTPTNSTMNLVIVWTIKRRNQFPLSRDILLVRDPIIGINHTLVRSRYRQVLFTRSVIWHPCDLVTCLQAVSMWYHREGPEYISPSFGWTNPTLDPWASTNTFGVPNATFIVTLLRCDVWCHQSTLPVLVIDMISWSKE